MTSTTDRMSAATMIHLVALLGIALAVGPALGWGLLPSIAVTAVVALLAHERHVVGEWRRAPVRLTAQR